MTIERPTEAALDRAAALLTRGELVGMPTETVYGLAANATDPDAVARIFAAKGRPAVNPLIVHLADVARLADAVAWPLDATLRSQLDAVTGFWPGPLTLVLPRGPSIPDLVTAGRPTVAVRVPDHPVALRLLERCPFPLAAPSANRSNYVSPTRAEHVAEGLGHAVAMILDGGPCRHGIESTIVSLGGPDGPRLLRPGAVPAEAIRDRLGGSLRIETVPAVTPPDGNVNPPPDRSSPPDPSPASGGTGNATAMEAPGMAMEAPGMMGRHYSPRTPLKILEPQGPSGDRSRCGRLAFAAIPDSEASRYAVVSVLSPTGDLREIASGLFAALRDLDRRGLEAIDVDACQETGLGRAIMDRLRRAATEE